MYIFMSNMCQRPGLLPSFGKHAPGNRGNCGNIHTHLQYDICILNCLFCSYRFHSLFSDGTKSLIFDCARDCANTSCEPIDTKEKDIMLKLQGTMWSKHTGLRVPSLIHSQCSNHPILHLSTYVFAGMKPHKSKELPISVQSLRFYPKVNARLPFEPEINVKKETLIYSQNPGPKFRILPVFGLSQLLFWGNLAHITYNVGIGDWDGTLALLFVSLGKKYTQQQNI